MPVDRIETPASRSARRKRAEAAVLKKFPGIMVGSSGWYRAVSARLRKGGGGDE